MRRAVWGALALLHSLIGSGNLFFVCAQESTPLPLGALLDLRTPRGAMEFSPDGRWLAYTVQNLQNSQEAPTEILLLNAVTRESEPLPSRPRKSRLPTWSPDGRYLAFLAEHDQAATAVWVWDTRSNQTRQISQLPAKIFGPEHLDWMSDSRHLLLTADASSAPGPRSKGCLATSADAECTGTSTARVYESKRTTSDQGSWRSDHDWARRSLVLLDVENGQADVLARDTMIESLAVSRDGAAAFFATPEALERFGSRQLLYSITEVKLEGRSTQKIATDLRLGPGGRFSVSPTGNQLAFRTPGFDGGESSIVILDVGTRHERKLQALSPEATREQDPAELVSGNSTTMLWSANGHRLFYLDGGVLWRAEVDLATTEPFACIAGLTITALISERGNILSPLDEPQSTLVVAYDRSRKCDALCRIDLSDGRARRLLEQDSCYTCGVAPETRTVAISPRAGLVAYREEDARHSGEVWISNLQLTQRERVTEFNREINRYSLGSMQTIGWLNTDGRRLSGALLLPANYRQGQRYPLIVFVYGGVYLSEKATQFGGYLQVLPYYNLQLLASRGYAVLMPDAPEELGTPMQDLAKDVLLGVNRVIEMGVADPNRLGVMGHSYGGYSVLSLLVQTGRFKAAVLSDAYANLVGDYGEMDANGFAYGTLGETGQQLMGGTPWQYRDRYVENSPFFYLDRVRTPILAAHGTEDDAIAPFLGDEIFVALRRLSKVVTYVKYGGEAHWLERPANEEDFFARYMSWFDKYVKGSGSEVAQKLRESRPAKPG